MVFDVITMGSGTVDVFVETKNKILRNDHGHRDVCYHIGDKVIIDAIRYATGGGGTNTAVSFARMGLRTSWLGMLGHDAHTHYITDSLKKEGVTYIGPAPKGMTGYSVVLSKLQNDRTILTYKGCNDDLSVSKKKLRTLNTKCFYLSSMIGKSFTAQKSVVRFAKHKSIPFAYNPSLYMVKKGVRGLFPILKGATVIVMNAEEAGMLLKTKETMQSSNAELLRDYCDIAIVTNGQKDIVAFDGKKKYILSPRKGACRETTGAGDAFASGVVTALIKKKKLPDALRLGYANAHSVIHHVGAKNGLLSYRRALLEIKKSPVRIREVV